MSVLDSNELLHLAQARTGLSDFGPDDFREGLEMLVRGMNTDADVRPDRVEHLRENILRLLINRLWFHKDLADHPQILDEVLASPIIISSPPRTASTKLHRLLGATGDFQIMEYWKGHMFARRPGLPDGGREQRIADTRDYERWLYEVSPGMITGHPVFTDEAEEEMQLFEYSFRTAACGPFPSTSYFEWLTIADPTPAYDYLKIQLQYLQWQFPENRDKPWLLKTPVHFGIEAQLCRIFESPRFIVTHRDPVKVVPSNAAITHNWHRLYVDAEMDMTAGEGLTAWLEKATNDHLAWRDANPGVQILDLAFRDITLKDLDVAALIYDTFCLILTARSRQAIQDWSARNPRGKHGGHSYSAEQFGTSDAAIRERFADYIERFSAYI